MVTKLTMSLFFNIAWAFPFFLWNTPQKEIKNGFYRFNLGLSTILWGMACILLFFNNSDFNEISKYLGISLAGLGLIGGYTAFIWNRDNISFVLLSIVCGILAMISYFLHQSIIVNIEFLNPAFMIGVLCLSNVLFAMILGHWFLNVPFLKITRLQKTVSMLSIFLVVRCVWDFYSIYSKENILKDGNYINGYSYLMSIDGIFLWIALFFGLLAPIILNIMTSQTLKLFSTQSATGLLYINVVLILMSEMIFKFYLLQYNWVL